VEKIIKCLHVLYLGKARLIYNCLEVFLMSSLCRRWNQLFQLNYSTKRTSLRVFISCSLQRFV